MPGPASIQEGITKGGSERVLIRKINKQIIGTLGTKTTS